MYESPSKSLESKSIIFQRFLWENILLKISNIPLFAMDCLWSS